MSRKALITVIMFVLFFGIGIGTVTLVNQQFNDEQAAPGIVEEEPGKGRITAVAAQVSPSIVGISNISRNGSIFQQNRIESTGSGVILNNEGYIVTNNHVVKGADIIVVTLADGNEEEAEIIGTDPRTDLAVVKVQVDNYVTPITIGDSDKLLVGEEVVAIGNPLGLRFARSVTSGIVSGLNRLLSSDEGFIFRLIQTDAAINPGNSGGALVNLDGELIGINTIKIAEQGFEGMGFSIPSNQVKMVVEDLIQYGEVVRPLMGIRIIGEISAEQARHYGLVGNGGVVIEPSSGGPAERAGLKAFDIISSIDNENIETSLDLQGYIFTKEVGDTVVVEVIRLTENREDTKMITVTLGME